MADFLTQSQVTQCPINATQRDYNPNELTLALNQLARPLRVPQHVEASMILPTTIQINIYKSPEDDLDILLFYDFLEFTGFNNKKIIDKLLKKVINNFVDNFPMKISFSYIHLGTIFIQINTNIVIQSSLNIHLDIASKRVLTLYKTLTEYVVKLTKYYKLQFVNFGSV